MLKLYKKTWIEISPTQHLTTKRNIDQRIAWIWTLRTGKHWGELSPVDGTGAFFSPWFSPFPVLLLSLILTALICHHETGLFIQRLISDMWNMVFVKTEQVSNHEMIYVTLFHYFSWFSINDKNLCWSTFQV